MAQRKRGHPFVGHQHIVHQYSIYSIYSIYSTFRPDWTDVNKKDQTTLQHFNLNVKIKQDSPLKHVRCVWGVAEGEAWQSSKTPSLPEPPRVPPSPPRVLPESSPSPSEPPRVLPEPQRASRSLPEPLRVPPEPHRVPPEPHRALRPAAELLRRGAAGLRAAAAHGSPGLTLKRRSCVVFKARWSGCSYPVRSRRDEGLLSRTRSFYYNDSAAPL